MPRLDEKFSLFLSPLILLKPTYIMPPQFGSTHFARQTTWNNQEMLPEMPFLAVAILN